MAQIPVGAQIAQVWTGGGPVLLANQDLLNAVTVCDQRNFTPNAQNADVIPPLGSIAYTGERPLYAMAPAGTAALLVIAGGSTWAPSPAQVALQIQAAGLAKDTSVQTTNTQLATGVAPFTSGIQSFNLVQVNQAGSPYTITTFGASGRIWAAHLSFALSANASHAGNDQAYCTLKYRPPAGSDQFLLVIEVAVGGASSTDSGDGDLSMPGLAVAPGGSLILDVNGGAAITNALMRASTCTLVSFP